MDNLQQNIFSTKSVYIALILLFIIVGIKIVSNIVSLEDRINLENIWGENKVYFFYIVIIILLSVAANLKGF